MTILTKLSGLLTSAIELPSALHAVAEAAREMESSRAIVSEYDGAQICGKLAARIVELERERDGAEEKQKNLGFQIERLTNEANELASAIEAERRQLSVANKEVEMLNSELNREREARRWRNQDDDPCPLSRSGQVIADDYSAHTGPVVMLVKHLDRSMVWRYLSPEDIP